MPSFNPMHAVALPAVGWVLFLAGLALFQDENLMGEGGLKDAARDWWWSLALEFAVLGAIVYGIVKGKTEQLRLAVLTLLAIATVRLMAISDEFLKGVDPIGSGKVDKVAKEIALVFTGTLIGSIGNFVMILVLGMRLDGTAAEEAKSSPV